MKTIFLTAALLLTSGISGFAETVEGYLLPSKCKNEDPAAHTKACALSCKGSGFGIGTADGRFLRFTPEGNQKAIALLEATSKTADLQVTVQGKPEGTLLTVESITWK